MSGREERNEQTPATGTNESSCCGSKHAAKSDKPYTDPVCGMSVSADTPHQHVHEGETWYFCNPRCRERFASDPPYYIAGKHREEAQKPQPAGTRWICPMDPEIDEDEPGDCPICGMALEPDKPQSTKQTKYTCPMHPEVLEDEPGDCPKCGMALEPTTVSVESENPELKDMQRRFWAALALTLPLFVLSMGDMVLSGHPIMNALGVDIYIWAQLLLAAPVALVIAWPFHMRGLRSWRGWNLNMWTLISLGVSVAFFYSVFATVAPGLLPESLNDHTGRPGVYFEASAVIITLIAGGQVLELRARERTGDALRSLLELTPDRALRVDEDGNEEEVPTSELQEGDRVRVRPGERIAVDGVVVEGASSVDESSVTGEPVPVDKSVDSELKAGTINADGTLLMRATGVGDETTLARIVALVSEAQRSRAPLQRLADKVAGWFVPTVIGVAILAFFLWLAFGPEGKRLTYALVNAVAVLIIACPCALGLATPMSIMVATGRGAQRGVLFANAEALESMARIETFVFDKTGTLTEGRPRFVTMSTEGDFESDDVLRLAASAEAASEHPIARAIVDEARARDLGVQSSTDFQAVRGQGIEAQVGDHALLMGNADLLRNRDIALSEESLRSADEARSDGSTVLYVAIDGEYAGWIAVADRVRETSAAALAALRDKGVKLVMLTGDHERSARAIADQLGIDEVFANVLPEDKDAKIQELQQGDHRVAMVGDGINDAPALARADIGIAMGSGTDIAMQSADVTLMRNDLRALLDARELSAQTVANIKQNLFFAFVYNSAGVPVAAGLLYPFFGILLSPMIGAAAMSLSSVSVIANALRLRTKKLSSDKLKTPSRAA